MRLLILITVFLSIPAHAERYTAQYLPEGSTTHLEGQEVIYYTLDQFQRLIWLDKEVSRLTSLTLTLEEITSLQSDLLDLHAEQDKVSALQEDFLRTSVEDITASYQQDLKQQRSQAFRNRIRDVSIGIGLGVALSVVIYSLTLK